MRRQLVAPEDPREDGYRRAPGGRMVVNWANVLYAEERADLRDPHAQS